MAKIKHKRYLVRAEGFLLVAQSACASAIEFFHQEMEIEDYVVLMAQLYSIEVQTKMAKELVADSLRHALLDIADAEDDEATTGSVI